MSRSKFNHKVVMNPLAAFEKRSSNGSTGRNKLVWWPWNREVHAFEKNKAKNINKTFMFLKIIYREDKPVFLCEMLLLLKLWTNSFIYNVLHRILQLNQDLTKRESNALKIRHFRCGACVCLRMKCTHICVYFDTILLAICVCFANWFGTPILTTKQ